MQKNRAPMTTHQHSMQRSRHKFRVGLAARGARLEHLDEGDGEVEVDRVAKVQRERHEEADWQDARDVELPCQRALHIHHLDHLYQRHRRALG